NSARRRSRKGTARPSTLTTSPARFPRPARRPRRRSVRIPRAGLASTLRRPSEAGEAAEVRSERMRDRHAPVGLLAVFEHRDERASHGEPRAVERVSVLGAAARRAVADLGAARLERLAVRARGDLAVLPLPR